MSSMKRLGWLVLVGAMAPAVAFAQVPPQVTRFLGDGDSRGTGGADVSRAGNSSITLSTNDEANMRFRFAGGTPRLREPVAGLPNENPRILTYQVLNPNPPFNRITRTLTPPYSARDWMDFLRNRVDGDTDANANGIPDSGEANVQPVPPFPPKNIVNVVDRGIWDRLTPAQQQQRMIVRTTITVTVFFYVAIPVFQNRCVIAYPCCCEQCYSQLVGYRYELRSRQEQRVIAGSGDFPITKFAFDRNILMVAGTPRFTTAVPRLCEYHYGPGANDRVVAAPLPLVATSADQVALTQVDVRTGPNSVETRLQQPELVYQQAGMNPQVRSIPGDDTSPLVPGLPNTEPGSNPPRPLRPADNDFGLMDREPANDVPGLPQATAGPSGQLGMHPSVRQVLLGRNQEYRPPVRVEPATTATSQLGNIQPDTFRDLRIPAGQ